MHATIFHDPYEVQALHRLINHLKSIDIIPAINASKIDAPSLIYSTPHIRLAKPRELYSFMVEQGFSSLYSNKHMVAQNASSSGTSFVVTANHVYHEKPPVPDIPILMVVHARSEYLKLSLNALRYNLQHDATVPVHILMSKPCEATREIVHSFKNKYQNTNVYETKTNSGVAGFNLLLQHIKPEKFVVLEEDFILPEIIKHIMPYWNKIFSERLDFFDVVSFSTSIDNVAYGYKAIDYKAETQAKPSLMSWNNNGSMGKPAVTGNTLCTRTKHYLKCSLRNPPNFITPDGVLMEKSRWSTNSIAGYHIGFNQEMDYNVSVSNWNRFPTPSNDQILYDRDVAYNYKLDEVYNLIDKL